MKSLAHRLTRKTVDWYLTYEKMKPNSVDYTAKDELGEVYIDIWNEVYDAIYLFLGGRNEAENDNEETEAEEVGWKAVEDAVNRRG